MVKTSFNVVDEIFKTKARQKVISGTIGTLGVSLVYLSLLIASIKPEDLDTKNDV